MPLEITRKVLSAIENSPSGIATLDIIESLKLCDRNTLKTTLSRLNKSGKILRLKRGVYSSNPLKDAFAAAQAVFNGYLGFSSALYLHGLITELPFTVTVVTTGVSRLKRIGNYEFRAVSLGEKAAGFEKKGAYSVSTRPKTLFDCLYLPRYSVEMQKLAEAYRHAGLSAKECVEFDSYVKRFAAGKTLKRIKKIKGLIKR